MVHDEPVVFVVDDDEAVRESLRYLVGSIGLAVETFGDADSFLEGHDVSRWGCLVLDVRLPGMDGPELHEALVQRGVHIPVIVITGHGDIAMAVRAMKTGALDFVEKPFSDDTLLVKIRHAIEHDAQRRADCVESADCVRRVSKLSSREREVLHHVVEGEVSREIGVRLGISEKTIETHRSRIMEKTGARNIPHLVRIALIARGATMPNRSSDD